MRCTATHILPVPYNGVSEIRCHSQEGHYGKHTVNVEGGVIRWDANGMVASA